MAANEPCERRELAGEGRRVADEALEQFGRDQAAVAAPS